MSLSGLVERKIHSLLEKTKYGELTVTFPNKKTSFFKGTHKGPEANIVVKKWSALTQTLLQGGIGFGESYIDKKWETTDLIPIIEFSALNRQEFTGLYNGNRGFDFTGNLLTKLNFNSLRGSKKNIYKHYDLGNDFYNLWLDPSMTYSSALYHNEKESLQLAQSNKYERILGELGSSCQNILEIGCGWGGFAEKAGKTGLKVDGITISPAQAIYAKERMQEMNLLGSVDIRIEDYREIHGSYDAICSIEMFEAVGREYWSTYFKQLKRLLSNKGRAVIQTITVQDELFEEYVKGADFIRKHIFPGGLLPSKKVFEKCAEDNGLKVTNKHDFGKDYGRTTEEWLRNFNNVLDKLSQKGFDEAFQRKWQFYLAACAGMFYAKKNSVWQFTLEHQDC